MHDDQTSGGGATCPFFTKRGPRAVVLCDGPPPPADVLAYWLAGADLFVCTDAAGHPYDHLPRLPDVVIGDFDSLSGRVLAGRGGPRFLRVDDAYTTDSEKALLYVADAGYEEVVLLGATGWRLDHTLLNILLLERFGGRLRMCVASHSADGVRVGPGAHESWALPAGTRFSLLPLAGEARGVTLEGAAYPLLNETLGAAGPTAISNVVAMSPLLLSVSSGSLLALVEREPEPQRYLRGPE